eukprot:1453038-Pleurochrysis_carterae.AAC.1
MHPRADLALPTSYARADLLAAAAAGAEPVGHLLVHHVRVGRRVRGAAMGHRGAHAAHARDLVVMGARRAGDSTASRSEQGSAGRGCSLHQASSALERSKHAAVPLRLQILHFPPVLIVFWGVLASFRFSSVFSSFSNPLAHALQDAAHLSRVLLASPRAFPCGCASPSLRASPKLPVPPASFSPSLHPSPPPPECLLFTCNMCSSLHVSFSVLLVVPSLFHTFHNPSSIACHASLPYTCAAPAPSRQICLLFFFLSPFVFYVAILAGDRMMLVARSLPPLAIFLLYPSYKEK